MDAKRYETEGSVKASYKKSSLMDKTVAILATAFFIFSGIPAPTSFAAKTSLTLDANNQTVPVVSYDPTAANTPVPSINNAVPSGSAIQESSPLQAVQPTVVTDIPPVPEGWTRAASNANYAFQLEYQRVGQYSQCALKLQDLQSGAVQTITTVMEPYSALGRYDVSPDGSTVLYDKAGLLSPSPRPHTLYIQRIENPAQRVTLTGELSSITFNPDGTATLGTRVTYPSGTVIESLTKIQLSDYQINPGKEKRLVTEGRDVFKYPEEKALIQIEKTPWAGNHYYGRILIYDTTNGTDRMRLVSDNFFGSGYPSTADIELTSITQLGTQRIVSVAMDAYAGTSDYRTQTTFITNIDAGKQLILNGWAESVTYQGSEAVYTLHLIHPEQFGETQPMRQVTVDLTSLQKIPNLSSGWTRAASNPNYAFQVRNVGSRQVLAVRDLVTGKETRAAVALKPFTIGAMFDIASDGKTLVYIHTSPQDDAGRTVVQSMSNRLKKVSLSGLATSVQFAQGLWVLTLNGRTVKVDPVKMKIVS